MLPATTTLFTTPLKAHCESENQSVNMQAAPRGGSNPQYPAQFATVELPGQYQGGGNPNGPTNTGLYVAPPYQIHIEPLTYPVAMNSPSKQIPKSPNKYPTTDPSHSLRFPSPQTRSPCPQASHTTNTYPNYE